MELLEGREWRGEIIAANSASTSDHGGEATFANCEWGLSRGSRHHCQVEVLLQFKRGTWCIMICLNCDPSYDMP